MKVVRSLLKCVRHPKPPYPVLWVAALTFGVAFVIVLRAL